MTIHRSSVDGRWTKRESGANGPCHPRRFTDVQQKHVDKEDNAIVVFRESWSVILNPFML